MAKKLTKQGTNFVLTIDKAVLESLGINENTVLEMLIMGDSLVIKPRSSNNQINKKRQAKLEDSAKNIMDKYESVLKKLAKT